MIDRDRFFAVACANLFGGPMSTEQLQGCTAILDEWERRPELTDLRMLAYMLATAKWETNSTMQPVREAYYISRSFEVAERWRRTHLRYYPFYGRGLPQLTWERNYRRMTELLRNRFGKTIPDFDLVKNPDQALIPEVAIAIMFEGMLRADSTFGDFTSVALEDFFTPTAAKWVAARTIINGTDHAADIAAIAQDFWHALGGPAPIKLLQYGSSGPAVARLQDALRTAGYYHGPTDQDFGPLTRQAVVDFQHAKGLYSDGVAGKDTHTKLGLA